MPHKIRHCVIKWIPTIACFFILASQSFAQPTPTAIPQSQELLNGLKVLFWPKPGSPEVLIKLRIHSGSAFDLAGKAGEMALLGDILFPNPETFEYFSEQMGGKLSVSVNYDSMTITMRGKAEQVDNILEVLRNAILATQLTPEVVARQREARIKIVRDTSVSPAIVADRAIARRLFGDFPYARPSAGSAEDLERVDRADLMLAKERFLNSNNATLAIVGGINESKTLRTLKRLFGAWRKSEDVIPSTFRAPKPPDSRTLIVSNPSPTAEVRLAVRGVSRADQDFFATAVLARLAQNRWQALRLDTSKQPVFVRSDSYMLPGMFVMGTSVANASTVEAFNTAKRVLDSLVTTPASSDELDRAKMEVHADHAPAQPDTEVDSWLDLDTYRLPLDGMKADSLQALTSSDLQRVATRLLKSAPIATVVVGDTQQLKSALQGHVAFEVLGEVTETAPAPKPPVKMAPNPKP
jgi:zinc protease